MLNKNINFNKKRDGLKKGKSYTQLQRNEPFAPARIRIMKFLFLKFLNYNFYNVYFVRSNSFNIWVLSQCVVYRIKPYSVSLGYFPSVYPEDTLL